MKKIIKKTRTKKIIEEIGRIFSSGIITYLFMSFLDMTTKSKADFNFFIFCQVFFKTFYSSNKFIYHLFPAHIKDHYW